VIIAGPSGQVYAQQQTITYSDVKPKLNYYYKYLFIILVVKSFTNFW